MKEYAIIIISAIFVNNIILYNTIGLCPFFGVSKKLTSAFSMGMAVLFVMTSSAALTWIVNTFVLKPFDLIYMQTIAFILIIAGFVQLVEIFMKKNLPALHKALGVYLPLITTNCAVLGAVLIAIQKDYDLVKSIVYNIAIALGFTVALLIMSGIREKIEFADLPKAMDGLPIAFITAALMSLMFIGFSGMI